MSTEGLSVKLNMTRRGFLLSTAALCAPAFSKEEFATLTFIPASKGGQINNHTEHKHARSVSDKKIVMIDPGHGGKDPGAIGSAGEMEKHVVLEIAGHVQKLLSEQPGVQAHLTREDDFFIPLYERVNIAHAHGADLFLSIHADGFTNPVAHGASVYALSTRGASSTMAKYMSEKENSADSFADIDIKTKDAGLQRVMFDLAQNLTIRNSLKVCEHMIKHISDVHHMHSSHPEQAAFVVLKSPTIPSVLIETSFITNPEEEKLLGTRKFRMKIAEAISGGVLQYFKTMA